MSCQTQIDWKWWSSKEFVVKIWAKCQVWLAICVKWKVLEKLHHPPVQRTIKLSLNSQPTSTQEFPFKQWWESFLWQMFAVPKSLPPAYVVRREVMFSQVGVWGYLSPRFFPRSLVPGPFPEGTPASGPMSFSGSTPVLAEWVSQDRYPRAMTGLGYRPPPPDWDSAHPPGLVMPRAACLLRFPIGGLSCFSLLSTASAL